MIRVIKLEEELKTVITIDGVVSADCLAVIETCCNQARSKGKPVHVVLRDVSAVDQAGQTLLMRLATEGIRVVGSGVYTSYLVESLTSVVAPFTNGRVQRRS